jgi:hypothetical protein
MRGNSEAREPHSDDADADPHRMMKMVQIGFAPRKLHMATSPAIFLVQLQSDRVSDILMLSLFVWLVADADLF